MHSIVSAAAISYFIVLPKKSLRPNLSLPSSLHRPKQMGNSYSVFYISDSHTHPQAHPCTHSHTNTHAHAHTRTHTISISQPEQIYFWGSIVGGKDADFQTDFLLNKFKSMLAINHFFDSQGFFLLNNFSCKKTPLARLDCIMKLAQIRD